MKSDMKRSMKQNKGKRLRVAMAALLTLALSPLFSGLAFAVDDTSAGSASTGSNTPTSGTSAQPTIVSDGAAISDPSTIWDWEGLINDKTMNVGRIWTDKTVSTGDMTKENITVKKADGGDFLTALTALSSTSNLSSTSTTPLDIVLVLDMSSSMNDTMGTTTTKKIDALKTAANTFVGTIEEQNGKITDANQQHQVALVSFNSKATTQQKMKTCAGDNATALKTAINNLKTSQGTRSDYGLQEAQTVLKDSKRDGAKQIVVFFTDGTPTESGTFDSSIASAAVTTAGAMKGEKATIYTIGVLGNADPSIDPVTGTYASGANENKFLHAVSSNYPSATYKSSTWSFGDRTKGSDGKDATFYKSATNATELNKIFEDISKEITEGAGYPTATEEGYASTSGYITFNDQLGDYMQVTDDYMQVTDQSTTYLSALVLVYDRVVYTSPSKSTYKTTNGSIDTYTFSGEVNSGTGKGNLSDLVITVTHTDDVATGDLVRMRIPASLIPLRHFNVDLTKNEMSVDETKPIALFYTTALKDGVKNLLANPDAAMAKYIATNTDSTTGKVNFYANKWNGGTLGDATAVFNPSSANRYYYFTQDTPIYTDEACTQRATSIDDGATYYYKHEYYRANASNEPVLDYGTRSFPGDKAKVFEGALKKDENNCYYFKAGTARLVYINELHKQKKPNTTETAADVLNPMWNSETSVAEATTVTSHLGNNGKLSVEKPATLDISKTVTVPGGYQLDDYSNTDFTFEVSIPQAKGKTFVAQVFDASGKAVGDSFKLAFDPTGKAQHSLKHGQTLRVFGLDAGWTYTVSEQSVDGFTKAASGAEGTFAAGQTARASFINSYSATGKLEGETALAGSKVLTGRDWEKTDSFTFKIAAETAGAPLPKDAQGKVADTVTVTCPEAGAKAGDKVGFNFGDIAYDKPGTYVYRVFEDTGASEINPGVTASQALYEVTVTVIDNGDGTLKVEPAIKQLNSDAGASLDAVASSLKFVNTYAADPVDYDAAAQLGIYKQLTGRDWLDSDEFTFTLEALTDGAPMPAKATATVTKANVAAGGKAPVTFGNITYTKPGTYQYQVTEQNAGKTIAGVAHSANAAKFTVEVTDLNKDGAHTGKLVATATMDEGGEAAFTNTYEASTGDKGAVQISATKTLTGRDMAAGEFTFGVRLANEKTDVLTAANAADGTVAFGKLSYTTDTLADLVAAGHATKATTADGKAAWMIPYVAHENTDGLADKGIIATTQPIAFTVTVIDNGDGTLTATADMPEGGLVFANSYEPKQVSYDAVANLGIYKQLEGRGWMDSDEFTFEIKALTDGAPMPENATATVTKANVGTDGKAPVTFGNITYTKPGTYQYQVTEQNAGKTIAGVAHSANAAKFTVEVTDLDKDGAHTGKLVIASLKLDSGTVGFTNTYGATNVSYDTANAGLNKVLTGRDWLDSDAFTFKIAAKTEGAPLPQDAAGKTVDEVVVTKANAKAFGFGTMTFTQDMVKNEPNRTKVFEYVVTEVAGDIPGVAYSTNAATIKVTVSDNNQGELTATAAVENPTFTNAYQTSLSYTAAGGLNVAKTLNGRDMTEGQFTIAVVPDGEAAAAALGIPAEGVKVAMPAAADGAQAVCSVLAGRNVTFTQNDAGKVFGYKVHEVVGTQDGYTYDQAERTVIIAVADNPTKAALTVTTTVAGGPEGTQVFTYAKDGAVGATAVVPFVNTYFASTDVPGGTAAEVDATKTLTGRDMVAGEFTFGVRLAGTDADVLTAANAADGTVAFGKLSYTTDTLADLVAAGHATKGATADGKVAWTIPYVAHEDTEGLAEVGVTATTQPIAFTVTVVDNGDGTLTAAADMPEGGLAFANQYATGDPATVGIAGVKVLQHDEGLTPDSIAGKFTFTISSADPAAPLPADMQGAVATTATNDANGNVAFGTIAFTLDDLNRALGDAGKKAEAAGEAAGKADEAAGKAAAEAATGEAAAKTAGEAKADKAAAPAPRSYTFVYTITETGSVPGVTNDATAKTVSVKVTDDGVGKLTAEVLGESGKPAFTFANSYNVVPTESSVTDQIDVTKKLTGRDMAASEFTFELLEGEEVVAQGVNDASGAVTFDPITYAKPGTHQYAMREVGAGTTVDGVTYDGATYQVNTTVTDDGKGGLTVTHKLASGEGAVFGNTYAVEPASAVIGASKALEGKDLTDGQFTFKLTGADGTELFAKNKADGTVTFAAITFDEEGTYAYTMTEVDDEQANVTYDTAAYKVTVTVTDDGKGHLVAVVAGDGEDAAVFHNAYVEPTPEPEPTPTPKVTPTPTPKQTATPTTTTTTTTTTTKATPVKTGDEIFSLAVAFGLMVAAVAGMIIAIAFARKRD